MRNNTAVTLAVILLLPTLTTTWRFKCRISASFLLIIYCCCSAKGSSEVRDSNSEAVSKVKHQSEKVDCESPQQTEVNCETLCLRHVENGGMKNI